MSVLSRFIIFICFFSSSALFADYLPNAQPSSIDDERITSSPLHAAIREADLNDDLSILSWVCDFYPESLESLTKPIRLVNRKDFTNDNMDYDYHHGWEDGITPLEYAVRIGNLAIVDLLLDKGADATVTRSEHAYDLIPRWYPKPGYVATEEFVKRKPWRASPNPFKYNMLYIALANGHADIAQRLLDAGVSSSEILQKYDYESEHGLWLEKVYSGSDFGLSISQEEESTALFSLEPGTRHVAISHIENDEEDTKIIFENGWTFTPMIDPYLFDEETIIRYTIDSDSKYPITFLIELRTTVKQPQYNSSYSQFIPVAYAVQLSPKSNSFFLIENTN
ncbi:MAG: hypothetical protein CMO81_09275 [Waddliaceae bacterium]|nr:hypothetical protein [Waddliaceae bacterium]